MADRDESMLIIFLDTETTGLNPKKHRTVEIAFKVTDARVSKTLVSYSATLSQPVEVWAEADPNSLQINGFTFENSLGGKGERVVEAEIIEYFKKVNIQRKKAVFLCQNPSFDRVFFSQIINPDLQEHYNWPYHWLDLASMYFAIGMNQNKDFDSVIATEGLSKDKIAKHYHLPEEAHPHRAMNGVDHLIACYQAVLGL